MSAWWVDRTIHADGWEIVVKSGHGGVQTLTPDETWDALARDEYPDEMRTELLDACREPDLCARYPCTRYATDGGLCSLDADEVA